MKSIILSCINVIVWIIHLIYNYKLKIQLNNLYNAFYTKWISYEFSSYGKHTKIKPKLFILGGKHISIGKKCSVGINSTITAWCNFKEFKYTPLIKIGDNCSFGNYCHISSINKIVIGNNVLAGKWVTITDNSHGAVDKANLKLPPLDRKLYSKGAVIIEDDVWIGDKATILPNVSIGQGSIIGANAVVTKDVPKYSVVAGNPATIIKQIS